MITRHWELDDDSFFSVCCLMACFEEGKMLDHATMRSLFPRSDYAEGNHETTVLLYELLEKYECTDFKSDCLRRIAEYAGLCLNTRWCAYEFMGFHYNRVADVHDGRYPEDLYPVLAEAWRLFATSDQPCPELNALVENDHAMTLFVANIFRTRLSRAIGDVAATKKSMESLV